MKSTKRLAFAVMLLGIAAALVAPFVFRGTRGVRNSVEEPLAASTRFDPKQAAALFVGIREFTNDVEQVPFAVDDAVDLAYLFVFDPHVRLVPARRVILILSGRFPMKAESRQRLSALREAGVEVRYRAEASDILAALREQAALAGRDGLLVVSIAAHGFLRDGNGYILGASSLIRNPATMLPATDIFETIATSHAQRSLVFLDACRERMVKGRRSVLADAMSGAPLVGRVGRTRGQAVFYAAAAGQSAYDDFNARNGVFTKTVIDGIKCGAAKVRGAVTVETLAGYVERNVQSWIRVNRDPEVGSATQVSIDGAVRNMPLAQCVPPPAGPCPARVAAAGTVVRAFSSADELLWQRDAGAAVRQVEKADLDGDGACETVVATPHAIIALDAGGNRLWSAMEQMKLTSFLTSDLLRQHTFEVVAIWNGERSGRLATYAPDGRYLGAYQSDRRLDHLAIGRPTNHHAPKIVVTSGDTLLLFDRKNLAAGKSLWTGRITRGTIASVDIADGDGNGKMDIALTTAGGAKLFVDFDGHPIGVQASARFERLARRR